VSVCKGGEGASDVAVEKLKSEGGGLSDLLGKPVSKRKGDLSV